MSTTTLCKRFAVRCIRYSLMMYENSCHSNWQADGYYDNNGTCNNAYCNRRAYRSNYLSSLHDRPTLVRLHCEQHLRYWSRLSVVVIFVLGCCFHIHSLSVTRHVRRYDAQVRQTSVQSRLARLSVSRAVVWQSSKRNHNITRE